MNLPIIVIGAGGHAKVVIDTLLLGPAKILGAVDTDAVKHGESVLGVSILGDENIIHERAVESVLLVNGIGGSVSTEGRRSAFLRFKERGYLFHNVIHPSAVISKDAEIGEGTQVLAGTVIQAGVRIGANCIINTKASVDHDCRIGDHVHIAPGVTMSGTVSVDDGCHIGSGATVIQDRSIGRGSTIGAGAVVIGNIAPGVRAVGVPAKEVR